MSENEGWIDAEILDNPTGEVSEDMLQEYLDDDERLAEGGEEAASAGEGEVEASPEDDGGQDETARQRDGILKELRETREELKRERQENAERNQMLEQRLSALFEAKQQHEAEQAPAPPDPEEDPLGALSYKQDQIAKMQEQFAQQYQAQQQQQEQVRQVQQVVQNIRQMEESFVKSEGLEVSQYDAAIDYAKGQVKEYYQAMGFPEAEAEQIAQVEQLQFAGAAIQRGVNPAEARYKMAVARGFQPAPKEPEGGGESSGADAESLAKTLQFKQQAVGESKSLSSVSGTSGKRRITLEQLAEAPSELFDKITNDPSLWEKINVEGSLVI